MKQFFLILISGASLFSACKKVRTEADLPQLVDAVTLDSLAAQRAWVEQVAKEKTDSIRIADSIALVLGGGVGIDTNALANKKNLLVAYVEVNNRYFPNVTCYVDENGKPVIDLALIFAPNINLNPATGKPRITYNTQVTAVLNKGFVRAVQAKGIKVGMTILGNHDNAGFRNFQSLADATAFAQLVAIEVRKYGLDAVDADDEYSEIPSWANDSSFIMVMSEIKRLLPDKFVMNYIFGGSQNANWRGKKMGDVVDAGFTAFYPQYPPVSYETGMNFKKSQLGASTSYTSGSFADPVGTVNTLKASGYKGIMLYDIRGIPAFAAWMAPYVSAMKGKTLTVVPGCLNASEADNVNVN